MSSCGRDLLGDLALGQHLEHLALARGELVERIGHLLIILQHGARNFGAEEAVALRDGADRAQQVRDRSIP